MIQSVHMWKRLLDGIPSPDAATVILGQMTLYGSFQTPNSGARRADHQNMTNAVRALLTLPSPADESAADYLLTAAQMSQLSKAA